MLGLIESLIAISAIAITCRIAGRIPAMMMTALAAAGAAIIMPPFASWEVESTTDLLTVVFQTIIGLTLAYRWPRKNHQKERPVTFWFERPRQPAPSLHTIVQGVIHHHEAIAARSSDIEICGELHDELGVSGKILEKILSDVLSIAISEPGIQRVRIDAGRRPALDQICVVAQCADRVSLPRIRILGQPNNERPLAVKDWPANCSTTFFDNGFERIYQISIQKPF
jgi:hypothetical protein